MRCEEHMQLSEAPAAGWVDDHSYCNLEAGLQHPCNRVAKPMQQGQECLTFGLCSTKTGEGPAQVTTQPCTPPTPPRCLHRHTSLRFLHNLLHNLLPNLLHDLLQKLLYNLLHSVLQVTAGRSSLSSCTQSCSDLRLI